MRTRLAFTVFVVLALLALATSLTQAQGPLAAAGTAFTYQGRLVDAGSPANGVYDLQFKLFDSLAGLTQIGVVFIKDNVAVTDGLFTVALDFGSAAFGGEARYLEVAVRPGASVGAYTALTPRQELTATPYALHAFSAPWAGLTGVPAGLDDGDDDTTYTAGTGLRLTGTQFAVNTTVIQRRVSGVCAPGSTIRVVNADGTVVCQEDAPLLRGLSPAPNTSLLIDREHTAGESSSATIGADGLPVISFYDGAEFLWVLHCGNVGCDSGNTVTSLNAEMYGGFEHSIALGADGLPVIAYADGGSSTVNLVHCGNAACSSGNTYSEVDTTAGNGVSLAIGADGLPVIAHHDGIGNNLRVAHCGTAACDSGNTVTTVDSGGDVGRKPSIALGADGLPVISYLDDTNTSLKVLHCGNATCNSGNTATTVDGATTEVTSSTYLAIGVDGLPLISYYENPKSEFKVAHCGNATCSSGNTVTVVDGTDDVGQMSSIAIGADGLPVIAYNDHGNLDLRVLHCSNVTCSGANSIIAADGAGGAGEVGWNPAITIGVDGLPLISYYDETGDLKVLHCANTFCVPYLRRR